MFYNYLHILVIVLSIGKSWTASDVETVLGRCCVMGANWAREENACIKFPSPVAGEISAHQSICLTAAGICCLRFYRDKQCEAGKTTAYKGQECRLPATEGGEYYKDCCEGCKLGLVSGSMAQSCSFRSLKLGYPWDAAYTQCCTKVHPNLPLLNLSGDNNAVSTDNSVLYPGSEAVPDSENLCLAFAGQLCAHICVPVPGSYVCQCRAGFTLSVDKKTCQQDKQDDRCSENVACEHICRDTGIAIECSCRQGYRLANDKQSCDDINECREGLHSCIPGVQVCINKDGSYSCSNPDGSITVPWVSPIHPEGDGGVSRGPLATPGVRVTEGSGQGSSSTSSVFFGESGRCPPGYSYNSRSRMCDDVDECLVVSNLCGRDGLCSNTIGSYTCSQIPADACPEGYAFDLRLQSCLDINECDELKDTCDVTTEFCLNTQGGFECLDKIAKGPGSCPAGYKYNSQSKSCEDVDECSEGLSICRLEEVCRNTEGAYECDRNCDEGFQFSSGLLACIDIDECMDGDHNCKSDIQVCVNEPGTFRCEDIGQTTRIDQEVANSVTEDHIIKECPVGYGYDFTSRQCLDIDECQGVVHNCTTSERCINTLGSFRCTERRSCPPGYSKSSQGICKDIDECSVSKRPCLPGQICINTDGGFECQVECREGFRYDPNHPFTCADVDECALDPCPPRSLCHNTEGSFICRSIYTGQTDDDLNQSPSTPQTTDAPHWSSNSIYELHNSSPKPDENLPVPTCSTGYERKTNNGPCEDIDECNTGTALCRSQEVCINHIGGYRCRLSTAEDSRPDCPPGLILNSERTACQDIDECSDGSNTCLNSTETCINSVGSYRCIENIPTCDFGFRYDEDEKKCVDIDECFEGKDYCEPLYERCTNLPGGYKCELDTNIDNNNSPAPNIYAPPSPPPLPPRPDLLSTDSEQLTSFASTSINSETKASSIGPVISTAIFTSDFSSTSPKISSISSFSTQSSTVPSTAQSITEPQTTSQSSSTNSEPSTLTTIVERASTAPNCLPGYEHVNGVCQDIDECESDPCDDFESCKNTVGTFRCSCIDGFRRDYRTGFCKDINECQLGRYDCSESQRCDNTIGSYQCVRVAGCGTGYTLNHNNGLCEDNDECDSGKHDCDQLGPQWVCINTKGSFRCEKKICPPLTILDGSGKCVKIECPQGYAPEGHDCVDIDECTEDSSCKLNENCINTLGSYSCHPKILCGRGFTINDEGTGCEDIDECSTGSHECTGGQQCANRRGTYTCQCPQGYRLNHLRECQDIDECNSYYGAICSRNAVCENTPGSFICNCNAGFRKTEGGRTCLDIDECSEDSSICQHRCINMRGSYQCICNAGYVLSSDNRTCIDVDECSEVRGRGRLCVGVCENTPGSFQCTCPPGYNLSPDQRTCKDINECENTSQCRSHDEQCINTRGSFKCMKIICPDGYYRDISQKSKCKKRSFQCRRDDIACRREPLSYSYNYIPIISNMTLPSSGRVDLFTMRGPLWTQASVQFALSLESVRAQSGVTKATRSSFRLRRTSVNQAVISLVRQLQGPQEVQLALSMSLFHDGVYSGNGVAKLLVIVSEHNF